MPSIATVAALLEPNGRTTGDLIYVRGLSESLNRPIDVKGTVVLYTA